MRAEDGRTPLHIALENEQLGAVAALLEAGANLEAHGVAVSPYPYPIYPDGLAVPRLEDLDEAELQRQLERFKLFNDCSPMYLLLEVDVDVEKFGLTEESIRAATESRLRSARLYSKQLRNTWLLINVNVTGAALGLCSGIQKIAV